MSWMRPRGRRQLANSGRPQRRAPNHYAGFVLAATLCLIVTPAQADVLDSLIERLDRLEEENWQLRQEVEALKAERVSERAEVDSVVPPPWGSNVHTVRAHQLQNRI